MYEKHFSFKCKPFELVPNPDFLFPSTTHKKAISYLDYGIKAKIGFILLSGEVGSGKTTIATGVERLLHNKGFLSIVLDGDNIRTGHRNDIRESARSVCRRRDDHELPVCVRI